jgi:MFS family permease
MMFSVQAKAVGPQRQGSVGLRQTMNRLAAIVIPPLVGSIADHWGAGRSFVILGVVLIVLCVPVTLITRRRPNSDKSGRADVERLTSRLPCCSPVMRFNAPASPI